MSELLVQATRVDFRYRGDLALHGASAQVERGERLVILGPNGGGKSTLLRLLLGLARPSSGEISWGLAPESLRIAYVPQFPQFDRSFPLRLREVVRLGLLRDWRGPGRWPSALEQRVDAALERFALAPLAAAFLTELSGGQMRRALLARAFVGEPELLALDEPTASLDEGSRRRLWQEIAALPQTTAVILVTHDLAPGTFHPTRAIFVDRRTEALDLAGLEHHPALCGHRQG